MFREVLIKPWIKKEYIWLILDSPEDYLWIITRHRDFLKLNSLKNCIAWNASWAISSCIPNVFEFFCGALEVKYACYSYHILLATCFWAH